MRAGLCGVGFAEEKGDGPRRVVGRLHADHEFEALAARVVPGETAFRFEKHRIRRLRLELPFEHQTCRIVGR